jgi:hypothetical protein
MLIQSYDDVANQTFLRLINLLNTAALAMGAVNQAQASLFASKAGLVLKDFFHNRLREYQLPKDFTITRGMDAATYAFSAGLAAFYRVKPQFRRAMTDRLGEISMCFTTSWVAHLQ